MVKTRPVIVVSPKLPYRGQIVTIVPISLTEPIHNLPYTVRLSKNYHPNEDDDLPCWAKCDMLMNISKARLNGFKIGRRKYESPQASNDDLQAVKHGVIYSLGLGNLIRDKE